MVSIIQDIINSAANVQVELWFEGDRLRFRVPNGSLPDDLRKRLSEHKTDILSFLRLQAAESVREFELSFGQQALWFLAQSDPASASYNVAFTGRISSTLNLAAFQDALQALVDRHAALRTTYFSSHGAPLQRVVGYKKVHFDQVNAENWDDEQLYQSLRQAYVCPFDLENGPLLRVHLWQRSPIDYVLLINMHHIAVDGWSVWILLDELRSIYAANTGSRYLPLPRPSIDYQDFVTWQHTILSSSTGEEHWQYWRQQLSGELPLLSMPTTYPRPSVQTSNGASENFIIPEHLTEKIKELAKTEGVTLYTLLFAAFQVLLHRYSGQDDIITGVPTFGRTMAEFARVVGDFINMIPLRVDFSGDPPFQEFLSRMKTLILAGLDHQDFPFSQMVANLGGHRDASRSPIFQVTFDVQRVHSFGELADLFIPGQSDVIVNFGGLQLQAYPIPQQEGQFDLGLLMVDVNNVIPGTLKYNTDIFSQSTIQSFLEHYLHLLENITSDTHQSLSSISLLSRESHHVLVDTWNQTQCDYPRHLRVHQLFEAQVERTPNAIAAIFDDRPLTYAQLNLRANQLAHHLRSLGLAPDQLVGVYLERSLDMLVAVLGVLKAGAAYVPMDPIYPPQRIRLMIEDSQMPVLITQQSLLDMLPEHAAQCLLMDENQALLAGQPTANPDPIGTAESLAYVIFTSGSTGRPKGVQIPHRAFVNFLLSVQQQPGIQPEDILASVTTLSFDIAGLELYLPLISGACVVILSADTSSDGVSLAQALDHYRATILQATPATWRLLVETGWPGRADLKMLCGGEPLALSLAQQLLQKGRELWNMYGPTETTIWSTIRKITALDSTISIGRPIANTQAYILDRHLQPVPPGVIGSLYLGGDGLARGYLNRPDLTAEKFIPHPFQPDGRIYHTGDLARYLPDGNIECLGRDDSQVKIRGFRIELGEIEATLRLHPAVQHAVVMAREDTPGDKRLVAYYTADARPTPRELSRFLREKLPAYMVPSAYVVLDAFPQTPNGKVDRKALPPPHQNSAETQAPSNPPTTPSEVFIAAVWQELLHATQINVFDNFFDLGGHSLLAMQVIARIQETYGVRIEPAYLRIESLGQLGLRLDQHSH